MNSERYALHIKQPTPEDVEANHLSLAKILAGTGQTPEELVETFHFSLEQASEIVDEVSRMKQDSRMLPPVPEYPWTNRPFTINPEPEAPVEPVKRVPTEEEIATNREKLRESLMKPRQTKEKEANSGLTTIAEEFLKGFMYGKFQFQESEAWGDRVFKVISASEDLRLKLSKILGPYGQVHDIPSQTEIHLNPTRFRFLGQKLRWDVPQEKGDFASFFMGLIHGRMSPSEHRISVDTDYLLERVKRTFEKFYADTTLLSLIQSRERYKDNVLERKVMRIKNPTKVVQHLLDEEELKQLPFYQYLKDFYLPQEESEADSQQ